MDDNESKAIWYVLRDLLTAGRSEQQERMLAGSDLGIALKPLSEIDLAQRLRHGQDRQFEQGEVILLKQPSRDAQIVVLSCKSLFEGGRTLWRFYLGMWRLGGRFIGVRFEPPGSEPVHSYYHSQLCTTLGDGGCVPGALQLPERYPAWPLPAASSLELLLCVVVSIHGMAAFKELRSRVEGHSALRRNRLLIKALDRIAGLEVTPTS